MQYWLLKTEPSDYSIDDLKREGRAAWSGVRNYQARNFIRDGMKVGDIVLFYHSSTDTPAIVGVAKVGKKAYPDPTAFDKKSRYYDEKSTAENPRWYVVDVVFVKKFKEIIPLTRLRKEKKLGNMALLQTGQRLSVQPVTKTEYEYILKLSK